MQPDTERQVELIVTEAALKIKARLTAWLEARDPDRFMAMEREVAARCRTLADELTATMLRAICQDKEFVDDVCSKVRPWPGPMHSRGRKPVSVTLLGGTRVVVRTPYYVPNRPKGPGRPRRTGRRGRGGTGMYPVLASLGIHHGVSPAGLSAVSRQVVAAGTLREARDNLAEQGLILDIKAIRRIAYAVADDGLAVRTALMEAGAATGDLAMPVAGKRVVVSTDGGRIRLREGGRRGRRRKKSGRRGFKACWREPKALTIYTVDDNGKVDRACRPIIDASMQDADGQFALIVGYLRLLGAQEAELVALVGDGAHWIWNRLDTLATALGIDPSRVVGIVDYYHAVEHLQTVADLRPGWSHRERRRWVAIQKRRLLHDEVGDVIAAIDALCWGRRWKSIETERKYFEHNAPYMLYAKLKHRGLPCGSGMVESVIRRVINLRMKGNSIYWCPRSAERVLHLRSQFKAGRWNEMVHRVLYRDLSQAQEAAA